MHKMKEKFNCETTGEDGAIGVEETPEVLEMRETNEADGLSATEGALDADFEALAGFSNDLPYELDQHSADNFLGKWNIPLDDYLRDRGMD